MMCGHRTPSLIILLFRHVVIAIALLGVQFTPRTFLQLWYEKSILNQFTLLFAKKNFHFTKIAEQKEKLKVKDFKRTWITKKKNLFLEKQMSCWKIDAKLPTFHCRATKVGFEKKARRELPGCFFIVYIRAEFFMFSESEI